MVNYHNKERGFLLVSLLLILLIFAVLGFTYLRKNNQNKSPLQSGKQGIEQAKENNELLKRQQEQIQDQLNNP